MMNKIFRVRFLLILAVLILIISFVFFLVKAKDQEFTKEIEGNELYNIKEQGVFSNEYFTIEYDSKTDKYNIIIVQYLPGTNSFKETKNKIEYEFLPQFEDFLTLSSNDIIYIDSIDETPRDLDFI